MAIADPHAIPETDHDVHEYVTEADKAWDSGDTTLAGTLYWSVSESHFATSAQQSHASHRAGLIAMNDGDNDRAMFALSVSHEPGAAELLKSLTNATHDDPTPSPDHVPETQEQFNAWTDAGFAAKHAGNWDVALGLFTAASQATAIATPGEIAMVYANMGLAEHELGHDDVARHWLEWALPQMADDSSETLAQVRKLIKDFGGAHETAADQSAASVQVAAGIEAYEAGNAHGARTALEAALHLDGPDDQKGRAHYYLGAMDYQEHKYADARNHIEAAVATAPDLERGWAEAALHWRWDEDPTP